MTFGLEGHHVLVTGGSGGIGRVTVGKFLEQGARVTLHYNSATGLQKLKDAASEMLDKYEASLHLVQADASDETSVRAAFDASEAKFGAVTILIANHGIFPPDSKRIQDMELSQWQRTLTVNLTGVFLFTKRWLSGIEAALASLKDATEPADVAARARLTRSNCVMVGSTSGIFGEAGHIDYSCSKSALTYGFMRTLKNEIVHTAALGRANLVAPGWVLTDMAQAAIDKDPTVVDKATQTVAMKKIACAEDVANGILVLASPTLSGHVSGTVLECTGGMEGRCLHPLS